MSNDKQIEEYRKKVETKHKELGRMPSVSYVTNQILQIRPGTDKINLAVNNSVSACMDITRRILVELLTHKDANNLLGTSEELKFGEFTAQEWLDDIKARVSVILWKKEKAKLDKMDKKLATLLSEEAQTANAIADIAGELGL